MNHSNFLSKSAKNSLKCEYLPVFFVLLYDTQLHTFGVWTVGWTKLFYNVNMGHLKNVYEKKNRSGNCNLV